MKKMEKRKEVYQLWWEYFKRSRNYSEEQGKVKLSIADFRKEWWEGSLTGMVEPFYQPPFEEWWEAKMRLLNRYKKDKEYPAPIRPYYKLIEEDMDSCLRVFKRDKGKEATLDEFKDSFRHWMINKALRSEFCICVDLNYDMDILTKEFKQVTEAMKIGLLERRIPYPSTSRVYIEELNGYLRIYDLRKEGIKWRDIAKREHPKKDFEDVRRRLMADYKKAEKIIKNVESGIFPGDYWGVITWAIAQVITC